MHLFRLIPLTCFFLSYFQRTHAHERSYPIVYLFPMFGLTGTSAVIAIQLGYSVSDLVAKCGVGLLVYSITNAKSIALKSGTSDETPLYGAT